MTVMHRRSDTAWPVGRVAPVATMLVCIAWLFFGADSAWSRDEPRTGRPPPGHERVVSVPEATEPPAIDGRLDDEAWYGAALANDFWISEQERWPAEQTEVLVTANRTHLYIGFRVYDSQPARIEALQTRQDSGLGLDDQVTVELDPYASHREISSYSVNAAGTQSDSLAGGRARQRSWKGEWQVATSRTWYGWSAEFAIPFSILNYEDGNTTFGVNFVRYHHRTTEWSRWADVTVNALPEEMGHLTDLDPGRDVKTRPLTVMPYVLVGRNIPNLDGNVKRSLVAGGLDVRFEPRQNVTHVLSIYPDFSQVESAVTDINFNYNEKFVDDNRPFFQEGTAYFGRNPAYFYSNRVPNFEYGAKAFSRVNHYQLGAFATWGPNQRLDFAARVQREFDPTHSLTGIVVGTDQPGLRNVLYAVNGRGREASGLTYALDAAATSTDGKPGDGTYTQGTVGWQKNFWSVGATLNRYSTDYYPANALLAGDLPDTRGVSGVASYYRDFSAGPFRVVTGNATWQVRDTGDGRLQRNYWYAGGSIELRQQTRLSVSGTGGQYRPVGAAPGLWSDAVNHDHYVTVGLDINTRSSRFAYGGSYSSGYLDNSDYAYGEAYMWGRPTATTFVSLAGERLRQFGQTEQVVVTGGWDVTPRHGLYGRYIWNDGSQYRLAYSFRVNQQVDFFTVLDNQPGQDAQFSAKVVVTIP